MKEIVYYTLSGEIKNKEKLTVDSIVKCNGMKVRCWLNDNSQKVGFMDAFRIHDENNYDGIIKDYINICTFDNLDENKNQLIGYDNSKYDQTCIKVDIEDIEKIEAILHSNPRWGTRLTNEFKFNKRVKSNR
ncbi:hypothetical protein [Longicatena caecimuris]|uniref:hypothetical protein n=1 Tax=Longicatena caecimuris TaxID=1796635 RepID=UPI0018AA1BB6|nr:hypothetical protein [Longicatena caecimuris]